MAKTPIGVSSSYLTAARFFYYHDWEQIADMLRDGDSPRPSKLALLDSTSEPGTMLIAALLAACGELESACFCRRIYSAEDLQALTGSGKGRMEKIVADLCYWTLCQRRQPGSADPKKVPGADQALAELDRLRNGERIFGFLDVAAAGIPSVSSPDASQWQNGMADAGRLFGTHGTSRR